MPEAEKTLAIAAIFRRALGRPVELVPTDNATTMVRSIPRAGGGMTVRLQRIFLDAPVEVLEACARWLRGGSRKAGAIVDRYVEGTLPPRPRPRPPARAGRGAVFDLESLFRRLNAEQFGGAIAASVVWGRARSRRRRRTIRFGSYDTLSRIIRIHPALDRPGVPEGYVAFVLFHEMLHAALPPRRGKDGRRLHHFREFRERERAYPEAARWAAWERRNLDVLLAGASDSEVNRASSSSRAACRGRS